MKKRLVIGIIYISLIIFTLIFVFSQFVLKSFDKKDLQFSPKEGEIEDTKSSFNQEDVKITENIEELVKRFDSEVDSKKIIVYNALFKDKLGKITEKRGYIGDFNFLPEQYINPTTARILFRVHIPEMPCEEEEMFLVFNNRDWPGPGYVVRNLYPNQIVEIDLDAILQSRVPIFDVSLFQQSGYFNDTGFKNCILTKGFNGSNASNTPQNITLEFEFNTSTLKVVGNNVNYSMNETNTKLMHSEISSGWVTTIMDVSYGQFPGDGIWRNSLSYIGYENNMDNFSNYSVRTIDAGVSDYDSPPRKHLLLDYSLNYPNLLVNNTLSLTNISLKNPFSKYYYDAYLYFDIWPANIIPPYILAYNNKFSKNNVKREHQFTIMFTNGTFDESHGGNLPSIGQAWNITDQSNKKVMLSPTKLILIAFENYKPNDNLPTIIGYTSNGDSLTIPPSYYQHQGNPATNIGYIYSSNLRKGYARLTLPNGTTIYSRDEAGNWFILYSNNINNSSRDCPFGWMCPQYSGTSFEPFPAQVGNYSVYWYFAPGIMNAGSMNLIGNFSFDGEKFKIISQNFSYFR